MRTKRSQVVFPNHPTILSASLGRAIWHPKRARDEEIRELTRGGSGTRATARRFGVAPSRIHQIVTATLRKKVAA